MAAARWWSAVVPNSAGFRLQADLDLGDALLLVLGERRDLAVERSLCALQIGLHARRRSSTRRSTAASVSARRSERPLARVLPARLVARPRAGAPRRRRQRASRRGCARSRRGAARSARLPPRRQRRGPRVAPRSRAPRSGLRGPASVGAPRTGRRSARARRRERRPGSMPRAASLHCRGLMWVRPPDGSRRSEPHGHECHCEDDRGSFRRAGAGRAPRRS